MYSRITILPYIAVFSILFMVEEGISQKFDDVINFEAGFPNVVFGRLEKKWKHHATYFKIDS